MSLLSDFVASGGKPKLITRYASGTGTYVPTADMARCLVRLQGGGSGGYGTKAGGGGAFVEFMTRVPIAGQAYTVGAGGAAASVGSPSSFGVTSAAGAWGGTNNTSASNGGLVGAASGSVNAAGVSVAMGGTLSGVSGGGGGDAVVNGQCAGFPFSVTYLSANGWPAQVGIVTNSAGVGSGGSSFYGLGGTAGNAPAAGNYGAGAGTGTAAGAGGLVEIWDFGA